jgi:hypothetical protein
MTETKFIDPSPELTAAYWAVVGERFNRTLTQVLSDRGPSPLQQIILAARKPT